MTALCSGLQQTAPGYVSYVTVIAFFPRPPGTTLQIQQMQVGECGTTFPHCGWHLDRATAGPEISGTGFGALYGSAGYFRRQMYDPQMTINASCNSGGSSCRSRLSRSDPDST